MQKERLKNNILQRSKRFNVKFQAENEEKLIYYTQTKGITRQKQDQKNVEISNSKKAESFSDSTYQSDHKEDLLLSSSLMQLENKENHIQNIIADNDQKQQTQDQHFVKLELHPLLQKQDIKLNQKLQEAQNKELEQPSGFFDFFGNINLFAQETLKSEQQKQK